MKPRVLAPGVSARGAIDWDRRLFDALIPLPDGTSYNAYLIRGQEKTVLLDTVDPTMTRVLLEQLADVPTIDYIIAHHGEQDHSGSIPDVLARYPAARVLCSPRARDLLTTHLGIAPARIQTVADNETLNLGDKTLTFIHTPWVHWPETMVTWLAEDRILFSCDFFGSHLATAELYADEAAVREPAKRYFGEIMMPFRNVIEKNLAKLAPLDIGLIAPSHGPVYRRPAFILDAYRDWVSSPPRNLAAIPYTSMHGSTRRMVEYLVAALMSRGVQVAPLDLAGADIGKLVIALVDAATIVIGTPTVLGGPHPNAAQAAVLANALRPKARFLSVVGSYGWGGKTVEVLTSLVPNLKVEVIPPVLVRGFPRDADFAALDGLAAAIAAKHQAAGLR